MSVPAELADLVPDDAWRRRFRRRLLAWYDEHRRPLPWRADRDPYKVWISETMLQQTTVAAVVPYFQRFLVTFPTVADLAAADEQAVLRAWEGLGYYRRARHLHAAAQQIMQRHDGQFPADPEAVRALPGVGRYTAGAILSIAFDQREPILEANTVRLNSRLIGLRADPLKGPGNKLLWEVARAWLPKTQVGEFNQALMELGGRICTPREPNCQQCPVATLCRARALGLQETIPPPPKKPTIEGVCDASIAVFRGDRVLLQLNAPSASRWAGLWDFVRFALLQPPGPELLESPGVVSQLQAAVAERSGLAVDVNEYLTTFKHGVTRFRITLHCYSATVPLNSGEPIISNPREVSEFRWVLPSDLENYPLSVTGRKLAQFLTNDRGRRLF